MAEQFVDFTNLVNSINKAKENNRAARNALNAGRDGDGLVVDYVDEENLVHIMMSARGIELLEFSDGLYAAFDNNLRSIIAYVTFNVHIALSQFVALRSLDMRKNLGDKFVAADG